MVEYTTDLQIQYNDCAINHDSLIDTLNKENVKIRKHNEEVAKLKQQMK